MFSLQNNWKIYATMLIDGNKTRVFLIGFDGNLPENADPDFLFRNGNYLVEICEEADKQKLIEVGLTTTSPMRITGVVAEPLKIGENSSLKQRSFEFTNENSFVQSKDGKFESQYCMCSACNHPVTVRVTSVITQAALDQLNAGATIELANGEIKYHCSNCGNEENSVYKDLLVWKTLSSHALSFEEVKKNLKMKLSYYDIAAARGRGVPEEEDRAEIDHGIDAGGFNPIPWEDLAADENRAVAEDVDFLPQNGRDLGAPVEEEAPQMRPRPQQQRQRNNGN